MTGTLTTFNEDGSVAEVTQVQIITIDAPEDLAALLDTAMEAAK